MEVNITARHLELTPALREYAEKRLMQVKKYTAKVTTVHIILNVEKDRHIAEVILNISRNKINASAIAGDMYAAIDIVMDKVIKQAMPQIVLLGQTQTGRDLAPRLAFRLNTAAVLDCIALSIDPQTKRMLMTKPVYGGNAQAIQTCETDPQIATVRSKAMSPLEKRGQ